MQSLILLLLCQLFSLILSMFQTKAPQYSSFLHFSSGKNLLLSLTHQSPGNLDGLLSIIAKIFVVKLNPDTGFAHLCVCMHTGKIIIVGLQSTAMMSFTSTDLPARLDQHSPGWTLFSHYLCITISLPLFWHQSFHVSFTLFYSSSLYHLLMLLSPLFQPSALLADLILPFLFMFLFPAGFWGLRTISVFQADLLALLSRSETQALLLLFSLWQSSPLIGSINNWKFCIGVPFVIQ